MRDLERKARQLTPKDLLEALGEAPLDGVFGFRFGRMGSGGTAHLLGGRREELSIEQEDPQLPSPGTTVVVYSQGSRS